MPSASSRAGGVPVASLSRDCTSPQQTKSPALLITVQQRGAAYAYSRRRRSRTRRAGASPRRRPPWSPTSSPCGSGGLLADRFRLAVVDVQLWQLFPQTFDQCGDGLGTFLAGQFLFRLRRGLDV